MRMQKLVVPMLLVAGIFFSFIRELQIAYYYGTEVAVDVYRISIWWPYSIFQTMSTVLVGGLLPLAMTLAHEQFLYLATLVRRYYTRYMAIMLLTTPLQAYIFAPGFTGEDQIVLTTNIALCWLVLPGVASILISRLMMQMHTRLMYIASIGLLFSILFMIAISALRMINCTVLHDYELSLASIMSIYLLAFLANRTARTIRAVDEKLDGKCSRRMVYRTLAFASIYIFLHAAPRTIDRMFATTLGVGMVANLDYAMNFYTAFGVMVGTAYVITMGTNIAKMKVSGVADVGPYLDKLTLPLIVSCLVAFVGWLYSNEIVDLAYGRGQFGSDALKITTRLLNIFMFSLPFMVVGMIVGQMIVAYGMKYLLKLVIAKTVVKAIVILAIIDEIGSDAFGYSALAMELLGVMFSIYLLSRLVKTNVSNHADVTSR